MWLCRLYALLAAVACAAGHAGAPPVIGAVVVYRHGDRTPIDPYPNDPYRDPKYWPAPWGELTLTGMRQHYNLGSELRHMYGHLIGPYFNSKDVYVRSTDTDRTLMSAQANLAGLYPISGDNEIVPGLVWRPTPVHTIPEHEDAVLAMKSPCPKFDVEMANLMTTDYFKNLTATLQPLYRYVSEKTGKKVNDIVNLSYIYDNLLIEELYNFTLPNWTKPVYPEKLREVSEIFFQLNTYTPTLARLKAGPLIKFITEALMGMVKKSATQKLWMLSAHDTTIASLLNALDLMHTELPPYASSLIFELNRKGDSNYIRVLYQLEELSVPNCGTLCPLYQWITNYAHLFPGDIEDECNGIVKPVVEMKNDQLIIYLLLFAIILILIINITTCFIMRNSIRFFKFDNSYPPP